MIVQDFVMDGIIVILFFGEMVDEGLAEIVLGDSVAMFILLHEGINVQSGEKAKGPKEGQE